MRKSDWYGGGAGIGGGANGKGNVTIGGNAQVKATGSAEYHDAGRIMAQALPLAMAERPVGDTLVPSRRARINLALTRTASRTVQK